MRTEMNGNVNRALMRVYKRSEDADDEALARTFVSIPPLEAMLRSPQHHIGAAKLLRRKRFDVIGSPTDVDVEQRPLTDYDTLLGLDGPVA